MAKECLQAAEGTSFVACAMTKLNTNKRSVHASVGTRGICCFIAQLNADRAHEACIRSTSQHETLAMRLTTLRAA